MFKKHLLRRWDWLLLDGENVDRLLHPDNWENEIRTPRIGRRIGGTGRRTMFQERYSQHKSPFTPFQFHAEDMREDKQNKMPFLQGFQFEIPIPHSLALALIRSLAHSLSCTLIPLESLLVILLSHSATISRRLGFEGFRGRGSTPSRQCGKLMPIFLAAVDSVTSLSWFVSC